MFFRKIIFSFLFFLISFNIFSQGTWTQKSSVFSTGRAGVVGFSIGTKGYFGTGWQYTNNIFYNDFWEWDQATNVWTQKANFPGTKRGDAVGFSIGTKGYIVTGKDSTGNFTNDLWEWNQATNLWIQKTNFPGTARAFSIGFSIGQSGYIGMGCTFLCNDFWEWSQATNTWTQKANFGGGHRAYAVGFSIGNKGYVGTGEDNSTFYNDFWEYDPSANNWTQKANFLGAIRGFASGFSIGTKGYIGTGSDYSGNIYSDFYEWDQTTNTWTQKANYSHPTSDIDHASFSIGCHGYFGCGSDDPQNANNYFNDLWEFTPDNLPPIIATIFGNTTICVGSSVSLTASGGTNYLWSTGATSNSINVSPTSSTTYSVTVSTDCASANANTSVTVVNSSIASFSYEFNPCKNKCVQFIDKSSNAFNWFWNMGDGGNSSNQNPCWIYPDSAIYNPTLIINCNTNCTDTFSLFVPYSIHDTLVAVYIPNAFSPNGDGENDSLKFYLLDNHCLKEFEISIYDRWGENVFATNHLRDSWDGTFNGKKLDSQTLTYYCKTITATERQIMRKGNISLVR
jgi:gliding motility-associated-like protein